MKNSFQESFIKHQTAWGAALLISWFLINMLVLSTTQLMEFNRLGRPINIWEPFCWEISSALMVLLLIPIATGLHDRWISTFSLKQKILAHIALTLPFSLAHILGMVAIRKICYWAVNSHYQFGNIWIEFIYEFRKDLQTYLTVFLVIFGYRLIVRRLQGEASYIAEGDEATPAEAEIKTERLLIKKLGREFLIPVNQIEWVEASGNYANLHVKQSVYPMRITMDKLEKRLPPNFIRVHRSTIVDIGQIKEVTPLDSGDYQLTLLSGEKVPLSRRYRENFKAQFGN